jgi:hypothetical protein
MHINLSTVIARGLPQSKPPTLLVESTTTLPKYIAIRAVLLNIENSIIDKLFMVSALVLGRAMPNTNPKHNVSIDGNVYGSLFKMLENATPASAA